MAEVQHERKYDKGENRIPDKFLRQLEDRAEAVGERHRLNQWLRKDS